MDESSNRYKKWIEPKWEKYFQAVRERPVHKCKTQWCSHCDPFYAWNGEDSPRYI